jgi:hypothetical protein
VSDNVAFSVADPTALVRSRIKEKRIYEARFLCRRLGEEIGAKEKSALERELASLLDRVEKLQQQARLALDEGNRERAGQLYREIEQVAIDVPGLAAEMQGLEGAEAVIARMTNKPPEKRKENTPAQVAAPTVVPEKKTSVVAPMRPPKRRVRLWLLAAGICLCLVFFLLLRGGKREKPALPVAPPAPTSPSQTISISPLVPALTERADQPGQIAPESVPSAVEESPLPASSMNVGPLQIEDSPHD